MSKLSLTSVLCFSLLCGSGQAQTHEAHGMASDVPPPSLPNQTPQGQRLELGSSAAFARDGSVWVASKQGDHVVVQSSRDLGAHWSPPVTVNALPEQISADGENRPKLAFTPQGSLVVTWTHPLSKPYSGEIRLARSTDQQTFSSPMTVHQDRQEITHRFDSLLVTQEGRVIVSWIDKRDLEMAKSGKQTYRGAAIYAAISSDDGQHFDREFKLADHSCECCRIAVANAPDGSAQLLWRHVFAPNERDHALIRVDREGKPGAMRRATFDHWKIDACPHHGPSLSIDGRGRRHAVWFNEGKVYYGRLQDRGEHLVVEGQREIGGVRAEHADVLAVGAQVAIVWKEFDGERMQLHALLSVDEGKTFAQRPLAFTQGMSDQPRLLVHEGRLFTFWRTAQEGFQLVPLL